MTFTALYDACVLYPAPLRDFLMWLAVADLYRARWSDRIHDEWIAAVLRDRPDLTRERLERTRALMNENVQDCLVTDFESLIEAIDLPDPDDRHVVAAAIRARADVIVTFNVSDFPARCVDRFGLEAQHPDEFIVHLFDLDPAAVVTAARRQRLTLRNPPLTPEDLLDGLARQRLPETVARLAEYRHLL